MKKRIILSAVLSLAALANSFACTNLIVGKNASTDGSTIVSYSADSYGLFGELYHYPAATYPKGTMLLVYAYRKVAHGAHRAYRKHFGYARRRA